MRLRSRPGLLLSTVPRLGLVNLGRVLLYRIKKNLRLLSFKPSPPAPGGYFLCESNCQNTHRKFSQLLFGWFNASFNAPPQWNQSPLDKNAVVSSKLAWDLAMHAVPKGSDIKDFWELSRFYWVPELALAIKQGDSTAGSILESWLSSWTRSNPPYFGINWSCGQEASIRLLNLGLAALILEKQLAVDSHLRWMILIHLRRIDPTLQYAIGQANNHGSAEAAALFVGGTWLEKLEGSAEAARYARKGRRWLENRAKTLIQADGTGNQYSTTYHRANLEVFSMVEIWRQKLNLPPFSAKFSSQVIKGTRWLYQLVDPITGDAPNFGPNDGSHLFSLTRAPYRDFRPTVHLAAALFDSANPYPETYDFEDRIPFLGVSEPNSKWPPPVSQSYEIGGHHILRKGKAKVFFRYPSFLFRPGHADCLHVDLWLESTPIFRDGGSFSYAEKNTDLSNVSAHNTIQFLEYDQMPRLSQFLYGAWPKGYDIKVVHETENSVSASAAYRNPIGGVHSRHVELHSGRLICVDNVQQAQTCTATLRWRLISDDWHIDENGRIVSSQRAKIQISCSNTILRFQLVTGVESLHYRQKQPSPVLEVEFLTPAHIRTEVIF